MHRCMKPKVNMFRKIFLISCYLFIISSRSFALRNSLTASNLKNNETHRSASRFYRQVDPSFENKFHLNRNTIIRTGESRKMGAKYLNDSILPSNNDCLSWCLETPSCNAAVYEVKNIHICYLFDCGPPDHFLCKFTQHDSFVSSVLKVSQHSYDLSQWGSQAKKLKELSTLLTSEGPLISSVSPTDVEAVTVVANISITTKKSTVTENPCHHYQFKCANSSECIAIYNVCDGIPQCSDESDESRDLKCHMKDATEVSTKAEKLPDPSQSIETKITSVNLIPKPNLPSNQSPPNLPSNQSPPKLPRPLEKPRVQINKANSRYPSGDKSIWPNRSPDGMPSKADYYQRNDDGLGSPFIHKHSQFVAANDPHVQGLNRWSSDYDQYPSHSAPVDNQYNPFEGTYQREEEQYLPNPLSSEYESVKNYGPYRQEDVPYWAAQDPGQDNAYPIGEFSEAGMHPLNKPNSYPDKETLYNQQLARIAAQYPEAKHRMIHKPIDILPPMQSNRPSDMEEYNSRRYSGQRKSPYMAYEEALEKQLSNYPEMHPKPLENLRNSDEPMLSNEDLIRASLVNQLPMDLEHQHHPHHFERTQEKINVPPKPSKIKEKVEGKLLPKVEIPTNTKAPELHPQPAQKNILDFKMSVTELYQANRTHAQETNSAVLALVLGIITTVILFLFLGIRIKIIIKKMPRKGRALAHDADYLVNGMYL